MQDYTEEQILEKYHTLPQELKTAMASVESSKVVQQIKKKYELNIEQTGDLAGETGLVLLGLTKPENFIRNLSERLEIDAQKAKEIALDVNSQIFSRVKESLKKIHGIGQEKSGAPVSQKQNAMGILSVPEKPIQKTELLELTKKHEAEKYNELPKPAVENPFPETAKLNYFETLKQMKNGAEIPVPNIQKTEAPEPLKTGTQNISKISAEEILKEPPQNQTQTKPQDTNLTEKIKDEITRYAKQTTEIKLPDKKEENKNIHPQTGQYPKGDPYKEPI